MSRIIRIVLSAWIAFGLGTLASADVRTLEAVGTVPIHPKGGGRGIPRDNAINQALREAVLRVAQDFLADRVIGDPSADDGGATDDENGEASAFDLADLEKVLGKKMVPYTSRFRMIEDRGRRPALFAEDPDVREEYVVIVEVQVDADRVEDKLVAAGLIPAGDSKVGRNELLLEVEGLDAYPAYRDFRALLEESLGAAHVTPVEMSRGRAVLDVGTNATAVDFLEALLTAAPSNLEIVPVHATASRVQVTVHWKPNAAQ